MKKLTLNGTATQTRKIIEGGLRKVLGGQGVDAALARDNTNFR